VVCQAIGNGLFIKKILHSEKMLVVEFGAKVKCGLSWLRNLFFMKLIVLNVHSSSIKPSTWNVAISTNLINFEILLLRMAEAKILCQILMRGLN
jgi:hypothetical protein